MDIDANLEWFNSKIVKNTKQTAVTFNSLSFCLVNIQEDTKYYLWHGNKILVPYSETEALGLMESQKIRRQSTLAALKEHELKCSEQIVACQIGNLFIIYLGIARLHNWKVDNQKRKSK